MRFIKSNGTETTYAEEAVCIENGGMLYFWGTDTPSGNQGFLSIQSSALYLKNDGSLYKWTGAAWTSAGGGGSVDTAADYTWTGENTYTNSNGTTFRIDNIGTNDDMVSVRLTNETPADDAHPNQFSPVIEFRASGSDGAGGSPCVYFMHEFLESQNEVRSRLVWKFYRVCNGDTTELDPAMWLYDAGGVVFGNTLSVATGDINAYAGNFVGAQGYTLKIPSGGSNPTSGSLTLISGEKTINTTAVNTGDQIVIGLTSASGTLGVQYSYSIVNGTSFTVTSLAADGSTNTADGSTLQYTVIKH